MRLTMCAVAAFGISLPVAAWGQVVCGGMVTETTTMTSDVPNCDMDPAVEVVGPAVLIMNGFTISCITFDPEDGEEDVSPIDAGVLLSGSGGRLLGPGTIENCHNGVVLVDGGGHSVLKVEVTGNDDGIEVRSDDNHLIANTVWENLDEGFDVEGGGNRFVRNKILDNVDKGLVVNAIEDPGDNRLHNRIVGNTIEGNGDDGIELEDTADETLVVRNTIMGNGERGIDLESDHNMIHANKIINNTDEGIRVKYDDEDVIFSEYNRIIGNRVFDHDIDIHDENPDCDHNQYAGNRYGSADPSDCIR